LLIVIAIIAILLSILAPALQKAKEKARLALCANNQRILLLGLNQYAAENKDRYPPAIMERTYGWYSWPNYLNYHVGLNDPTIPSGGSLHTYLGKVLPDIKVFMCPLSFGDPVKYQHLYENRDNIVNLQTLVSYNMFWGGYTLPDIDFVGPRTGSGGRGTSRLLVSDVLSWWEKEGGVWFTSHPTRNSVAPPEVDPVNGNYVELIWWEPDSNYTDPPTLDLNAGYTDGHVERYHTDSSIDAGAGGHGPPHFYITKDWR